MNLSLSLSLSLGFFRPLTNRETLEVVGILSILSHKRVLGRRDVRVWNPLPSRDSLVVHISICLSWEPPFFLLFGRLNF